MKAYDDIVRKILRETNNLKTDYYNHLDGITNGYVEMAEFNSRLSSLSFSILSSLSDNKLEPQELISILNSIEEYIVVLEDQNLKDQIEITFFEGILSALSDIEHDEPNYRYVGLFRDNLGPASGELCEKNHAFWREVIRNKNEDIRKHYAELEKNR